MGRCSKRAFLSMLISISFFFSAPFVFASEADQEEAPSTFGAVITPSKENTQERDSQKAKRTSEINELNTEEKKYLGIHKTEWEQLLDTYPQLTGRTAFFEALKESSEELKEMREAVHYEKLGQNESIREKHRKNPLLQRVPKRTKNPYITNLDLDKGDFDKVQTLIPILQEGYRARSVGYLLPYISLCLNEGISISDIRYYCRLFVKEGTPVDVATARLLRLTEKPEEFDRNIFRY